MSAVLLEFIEPYRDAVRDDAALENLIALGIVAWNVALLPPDKREESLNDFCAKLFRRNWKALLRRSGRWLRRLIGRRGEAAPEVEPSEVAEFKQVAHELIERKLRYYPHNRRFIMDYRLTITADNVHLSVVSTLPA